MNYSLDPKDVKKVIDAKLNEKQYDENQFRYYHLHRNYFNVKNEIKTLKRTGEKKYLDNMGHTWDEQHVIKNFYHMPTSNWVASIFHITPPYSRKFLRDDNISGLLGEFEIIIRRDGKRIDALVPEKEYQETYNFGRTREWRNHKKLDVDTHRENGNYTFKMDMGRVIINE